MISVIMKPRLGVGELTNNYAEGKLTYDELEEAIRKLGCSTLSLFENVCHIIPKTSEDQEEP